MKTTITRLKDLRYGDRILSIGSISHRSKPLTVQSTLGPVNGSPAVQGVYVGRLSGGVEFYLYPSQCDGQDIVVER